MKTIQADVVVIGSGPAGAACAYTTGEAGLKTVIVEQGSKPGGMSGGGNGLFAVESDAQRAMNYDLTVQDCYLDFMAHTQYMADARIVREVIGRSADTVEWLKARGGRFESIPSAYLPGAPFTWHKRIDEGRDGPLLLDYIYDHMRRDCPSVSLVLNTRATALCREENGPVTGVLCQGPAGETLRYDAPFILIATGGFSSNREMVKEFWGYEMGGTVFSFGAPAAHGDGVRMAWAVGADKDQMLIETIACMEPPYNGPGGVIFELGCFRQPVLLVNMDGERFMNEALIKEFGFTGNAVYRQPGHCAYAIIDESINRYYETHPWDYQLTGELKYSKNIAGFMREKIAEGYPHYFIANSLEELAAQAGIDSTGLRQTIAAYNAACSAGRDTVFFKDAKYLRPLTEPPYYAVRYGVGAYGTMGGIRINHKFQVLDTRGQPISGLYAGGFDANGIMGKTFPFKYAGFGSTFSFVSGRAAGENIIRTAAQ